MSETPRTDERNNELLDLDSYASWLEMYAFARQLERELNAANAIIRQQQLLDEENLSLRQRIKRLEEAGDELAKWADRNTPVTILNDWTRAKEAKP